MEKKKRIHITSNKRSELLIDAATRKYLKGSSYSQKLDLKVHTALFHLYEGEQQVKRTYSERSHRR